MEGATGGRDDNKISTFSVPYFVTSSEEIPRVGSGNYLGLKETGRTWEAWNDGTDGWKVTVQYKGHMDGDESAVDPRETEQWDIDFDFSEEPLESHPDLRLIIDTYGGYIEDNEVKFPQRMPAGTKSKSGLGGKSLSAGDRNPMYGTTTYPVMTARVSRSWSAATIPANAVNNIGKIYKIIPGIPDTIGNVDFGDRDWLTMPPKISQNGSVWRITNEWLLSPAGGFVTEVHPPADS